MTARLGLTVMVSGWLVVSLFATLAAADDPPSDSIIEIVIKGQIEAPLEQVRSVLLDLESFGEWFPSTSSWSLMERHEAFALVHGTQNMPWPLHDRDYVVRYRWTDPSRDHFELEAVAQHVETPAPGKRVIRLDNLRTVWKLAREGQITHVEYHYAGDPGIPLPRWVMSTGWERLTGVVIEALAERVNAQGARAGAGP